MNTDIKGELMLQEIGIEEVYLLEQVRVELCGYRMVDILADEFIYAL